MATLVLAAAGSALGGAVGGSVAGLTSMVLGKAIGATVGSMIDQRVMGLGAEPVETGRVDRFRIMGSSEGAGLPRVFGRMRIAGQIIWSSRFLESFSEDRVGGKGGGGGQTVREFSYSVSLAIALCEGEVLRIGRIWADGQAIDQKGLTLRLHKGGEDQLPDPVISALEGPQRAPAYRGTAYIVLENLDLTPFGNRIPQFNVEVFRRASGTVHGLPRSPFEDVRGVALVPGSGEYSLATEPVYLERGKGRGEYLNVHNDLGEPDLNVSLDHLWSELPATESVSLVVSWFGDDLRCARCALRPAVEQKEQDAEEMPWRVAGLGRSGAKLVSRLDGRPLFGGTPTDQSVIQAIQRIRQQGKAVMFYPFILMDILADNGLQDPWTGGSSQPAVPWRGRITLSHAPGRDGSPDKTGRAADEVSSFFGSARPADFRIQDGRVGYDGPDEWSYRRFILHYAHLCVAAGGIDSFCIGSELRGLTHIRDGATTYPAVRELRRLAQEVKAILGSEAKVGYAADWSEYFGHQPADASGDAIFNLDPLWADPAIDFVGIDNYMPLSDWRDETGHRDAARGSIHDLDYLSANVAGGEGFDWYYPDEAAREVQDRTPISDGAYGEDWIFRYKDLVGWWSNRHENRIGGVKAGAATDWRPGLKPIWFTELGCPAVDKGTNQPNVFFDPKSSESFLPYHSNGMRDDYIQARYLQATFAHWGEADNNPVSSLYGGRMVDMSRAHVWAWDARPWPDFPSRVETWIDGANYERGHWLNGRVSSPAVAEVVGEICSRANANDLELSSLFGSVTGYAIDGVETARQSLQPLMLAYGVDSHSDAGTLKFQSRSAIVRAVFDESRFVSERGEPTTSRSRGPLAESVGRLSISFIRADSDYQPGAAEASNPAVREISTAISSVPLVLSQGQAKALAERWMGEAGVGRDTIRFTLPQSDLSYVAGDVISVGHSTDGELYRIDRVEDSGRRIVEAVRIEPSTYDALVFQDEAPNLATLTAPTRVYARFLDLPLLSGREMEHTPHVAVSKSPWAGPVAIYSAGQDAGYSLAAEALRPAVIGETLNELDPAIPGVWMRRSLLVKIESGRLQSGNEADVLNGGNTAALRSSDVDDWEVVQFRSAELVDAGVYRLDGLLRGQAGTDPLAALVLPAGSEFVLLDGAPVQLDYPVSARGIERHYRVGPSRRSYDDPSFLHREAAFEGVGLRPYAPAHLRARRLASGAVVVSWIRRSRVDGDSWIGEEIPLGEDRELYRVRVISEGVRIRETDIPNASFTYTKEAWEQDGRPASIGFEVAQVSSRVGPGPFQRIQFHA